MSLRPGERGLLERYGWKVEHDDPLELRPVDRRELPSLATWKAAMEILDLCHIKESLVNVPPPGLTGHINCISNHYYARVRWFAKRCGNYVWVEHTIGPYSHEHILNQIESYKKSREAVLDHIYREVRFTEILEQ